MWNKLFVIIIDLYPCFCLWNYALKQQRWKFNEGKTKKNETTTLANFIVPLNRSIVMDKFRVLCSKYHKLFIIIYYFASMFHYITTDSKFMFRLWFFPRWKKNNTSLNRSFAFCLHCAMIRIYIVIEFLSIYRVKKIV